MAVLIGIDWGTTSFRAWLMGAAGDVVDRVEEAAGILSVTDGNFDRRLETLLQQWPRDVPIIASGMITSRNGWVETPYLPLPLDVQALAGALVPFCTASDRRIHFITGAATAAPDVMRGEETEIIGHLAAGGRDGVFVLPGTHSKWVRTAAGKVVDFHTCMTGEVYALLRGHSILGRLAAEAPFAPEAFRRGVEASGYEGALLSRVFSARTLALFDRLAPEEIGDYLAGLLIGDELRAGLSGWPEAAITIIGRGDLAERYRVAFAALGVAADIAPPGMARLGHWHIARLAGLVS